MAKLSKRIRDLKNKFDTSRIYSLDKILEMVCKSSSLKFDESVDVIIRLGVDTKKSDQVVRGCTVLPCGTGKNTKVVVFDRGKNTEAAKMAGAEMVGMEDLADDIRKNRIDFDVVVASSDTMDLVNKLGPILGPRGLMPNAKFGTITDDVALAVSKVKSGQVSYKADKSATIKTIVGKVSFKIEDLALNFKTLLSDIKT
jgi:large subunit ribosomal protein L1